MLPNPEAIETRAYRAAHSSPSATYADSTTMTMAADAVRPKTRFMPDSTLITSVRVRTAASSAEKAVKQAQLCEGTLINVVDTLEKDTDYFLLVLAAVKARADGKPFMFVIYRCPPHKDNSTFPVALAASSIPLLRGAVSLLHAKLLNRIKSESLLDEDAWTWTAEVSDLGRGQRDLELLWDVLRKTPYTIDPLLAPPGARTYPQLLSAAHVRLRRLTAKQAHEAATERQSMGHPPSSLLVAIRPVSQRLEYGVIPGAMHVERILLESAFDVKSTDNTTRKVDRFDSRTILFDQDGTASALAAISLHDMGLLNATDMIGGFAAWRDAGLPTTLLNDSTNDP